MISKVFSMLKKELKQMLRDQKMRVVVLVTPVMELLIFAFALTMDVKNIDIAVVDYDNSFVSREIIDQFKASGYFYLKEYTDSPNHIKYLLDKGEVRGALIIEKGTERKIIAGSQPEVQIVVDATMSNDASIISSYAASIIGRYVQQKNIILSGSSGQTIKIENKNLFNENLNSRLSYIPGLISLMIMVTSMLLTSIAIVREKEVGTIEQVMVTPISKLTFILGKTLPFIITGFFTVFMMFILARIVFHVEIQGSILLLGLVVFINILSYIGLALLVSTLSYTQQQALLTSFFIMMPSALLSGYLFPIMNMPEVVQMFTYLVPMRWGFEGIIGVVVKGADIYGISKQLLWSTGHAIFFISLSVATFRKSLD